MMSRPTGAWLPLMEYSIRKGISLSTLRRYIKAKKVEYRIESGRYLLFDDTAEASESKLGDTAMVMKLEKDLKTAREEIAELKTLIALYEESPPTRSQHPPTLDH